MVRRAQLQRKTGSPLISGYLTPQGLGWGWVLLIVIALVAAAGAVWWFLLR